MSLHVHAMDYARTLFSDLARELQSRQFIGLFIVEEYSAFMGMPCWSGHVALALNRLEN